MEGKEEGGVSKGQSPGVVANAMKAARAAQDGQSGREPISGPIPFPSWDQTTGPGPRRPSR